MLKLVEGENGAIRVEVDWLKEKGETMEAKYKGAEQENSQLKREIEELWASFIGQKKEVEELQEGLLAQKKDLEVGFSAQKKELEIECQRQVDEMYFFGYCCCIKKNGIMHNIPPLPSDDEDEIPGGSR